MLTTVVLSQQERADGVQIPWDKKASEGKSFTEYMLSRLEEAKALTEATSFYGLATYMKHCALQRDQETVILADTSSIRSIVTERLEHSSLSSSKTM